MKIDYDNGKERVVFRRRPFKQLQPLQDRLSVWANKVREQAAKLPPGAEKNALLKKAGQADTASHVDEWVNSSGLQSPK